MEISPTSGSTTFAIARAQHSPAYREPQHEPPKPPSPITTDIQLSHLHALLLALTERHERANARHRATERRLDLLFNSLSSLRADVDALREHVDTREHVLRLQLATRDVLALRAEHALRSEAHAIAAPHLARHDKLRADVERRDARAARRLSALRAAVADAHARLRDEMEGQRAAMGASVRAELERWGGPVFSAMDSLAKQVAFLGDTLGAQVLVIKRLVKGVGGTDGASLRTEAAPSFVAPVPGAQLCVGEATDAGSVARHPFELTEGSL